MSDTELTFSPLDGRYKTTLPWELSEQASLKFQLEVEKAWLLLLCEEGLCPKASVDKINAAFDSVTQEKIDEIEATTRHATRALVEAVMAGLEEQGLSEQANWVHVGLTSFDTVDTAQRLRLKSFWYAHGFSKIAELKKVLQTLATKNKDLKQVGRTHGQWAVPTLFGLSIAEAHERIAELEPRLLCDVENLRGQASGAIGGYHATSLLFKDPIAAEIKFTKELGLKPHYASTQILPPEDILALAQSAYLMASVVAKLATDFRHLARSEINEVQEGMAKGQVGSSTMPQKRNPWNLEHICSLHKILLSKLQLIEMDVISEHQRDLTNSASGRFYFEFFSVFQLMIERSLKVFPNLEIHSESMHRNLNSASSSVLAEAFYVLATKKGLKDAHHFVREASRESEKSGKDLLEVLSAKKLFDEKIDKEQLFETVLRGSHLKFETISKKWKE